MLCEGGGGGEEVQNWVLEDGVRKVLFFGGGKCGGIAALVARSFSGACSENCPLNFGDRRRNAGHGQTIGTPEALACTKELQLLFSP